jgi:feruloyl-CoA synthase
MTHVLQWVADPFRTDVERRSDGSLLLRPQGTLAEHPSRLMDFLEHWARLAPERTLVARRGVNGEWHRVSYSEMLGRVKRVAAGLASRELSEQRPIVILSGNSIEHLVLGFAAMWVGVPYCPMSPAYSLASSDLRKARYVIELLTPGMIAAFDLPAFARVLSELEPYGAEVVTTLAAVEAPVSSELEARHARTGGDTLCRFLLTSGSTGQPKAVITTNRMVCSNAAMLRQALPFLADEPPVLVDWLPWNHTFGGSHNIGLVLGNGGTLYIDDGKPTPAGIATTIRNLREVAPSVYFNVPAGFEMLARRLHEDEVLRRNFYSRLRACFFAGAALSQHTWDALDASALAERAEKVPMLSGLGATETGPSVTFTTPSMMRSGVIGLPAAGNLVKLAPVHEKLEICVRSPSVTPGYWRQSELTANAFDEEGFYRLGDAVRLIDATDPTRGLLFDGRIGEDFKLANGSWVSVGPLRAELIAALAPVAQDVVIAGLNAEFVAALIVADVGACAGIIELQSPLTPAAVARHPRLIDWLRRRLIAHASVNPASTRCIRRALVLETPLSLDQGEITDKGSVNQRAVLRCRAEAVAELYALEPALHVVETQGPSGEELPTVWV